MHTLPAIQLMAALVAGEQHAYGLIRQVEADCPGYLVARTTLYSAIQRLERDGLVESVAGSDPVRYRLTRQGYRVLRYEAGRVEIIARVLRQRL